MVASQCLSKSNPNGSVDIWIAGWRINFPTNDEPFGDRLAAPDDAVACDASVKVKEVDGYVGVACNGGLVLVKPTSVTVVPEASDVDGSKHTWRAYRMHG